MDDRYDDPLTLLTDCERITETVPPRDLHARERDPSRAEGRQHLPQNVFGVAAAIEDPLDRLERPGIVDRAAAAHAAAISQSPSSNPRIASLYQPGIVRARRSARSTRTSVCVAVTINTSSSTR